MLHTEALLFVNHEQDPDNPLALPRPPHVVVAAAVPLTPYEVAVLLAAGGLGFWLGRLVHLPAATS